jgi:hypothetical protein
VALYIAFNLQGERGRKEMLGMEIAWRCAVCVGFYLLWSTKKTPVWVKTTWVPLHLLVGHLHSRQKVTNIVD